MRSSTRLLIGLTALSVTGLLSCDRRELYGPSLDDGSTTLSPLPEVRMKDTPGYPMDVPRSVRSASDIESMVRAQGGLATVALKAPESERAAPTGYRAAVSASQADEGLKAVVELGAEVLDFFDAVNIATVRIPDDRVRAIQESPFVDWVEPAGPREALAGAIEWPANRAAPPPLPQPTSDAVMTDVIPWNVSQVNAPAAWSRSTGASAKVMIIGGGIGQHSDNPYVTNCGGLAHSCDSRFIDGSLMMGNMFARQNGDGVIGVAKGAAADSVYVWRVYDDAALYYPTVVYGGFSAAYYSGYRVVLYAFGHSGYDQTEAAWIGFLWNAGAITVSLVPNNGIQYTTFYPASVTHVVGVSGVRNDGQFAAYPVSGCDIGPGSAYGPMVDVAGPFWSYTTLTTTQGLEYILDTRDSWLGLCNTEMAAAHVTGVIALLQDEHPTWSPTDVVEALQTTASNHANPNQQIGYGIPNANAALSYQPTPMTVTISGPSTWPAYQMVTVQAFVSHGDPTFTYVWRVNGSPYGGCGDKSWCDKTMGPPGSSVFFQVTVTDKWGKQATDYHMVIAQW